MGGGGFKFVQMEGSIILQGEISAKEWKYIENFKNLFLHNQLANFYQAWYIKSSLGERKFTKLWHIDLEKYHELSIFLTLL
jgi:hypothetical protein